MASKRIRIETVAKLINEQLPQYEATITEGHYDTSRKIKGKRYVAFHRTAKGKCLQVRDKGNPWGRIVYECNLAKWYQRVKDAIRWFEEQGGAVGE